MTSGLILLASSLYLAVSSHWSVKYLLLSEPGKDRYLLCTAVFNPLWFASHFDILPSHHFCSRPSQQDLLAEKTGPICSFM